LNDRALCVVELGDPEGALSYFDRGIEAEPDYATVYHNKGWLLNKVGRHKEAMGYFHKALELDPGRAVTYENLADCLGHLAQYQEAFKAYERALSLLKPNYRGIKRQIVAQMRSVEEKISQGESRKRGACGKG
jgi:tetratricopeptide (TPR) repeat protein